MNLQDIRGNEHVKRAIEVALVANLSITFVGEKEMATLFANYVLRANNLNVRYQNLCLCGNYNTSNRACCCSAHEINSLRSTRNYQEALLAHVVVQVVYPPFEHLVAKRLPESDDAIMARVLNARQVYKKYSVYDLDETCLRLLGGFYKVNNGINQAQIERIMEVASAISALGNHKNIHPSDLAEALQYSGSEYLEFLAIKRVTIENFNFETRSGEQ